MTSGGQQFGKYRILEELGTGGFATVYKAVDTTLDREVALKILHPPLLTDRRFVQNFRLEAKTLAALRHPHIITIYEIGEIDGRIFIAMDLARGVSLAKAIASRQRIAWNATLALLKPVCEALDYAHEQSVVHRDLKPANILIDKQRGALLTDFGFARLMAENSASMSMSGGLVGTPGYIAPEVWEDNAANVPVDIYALGCIAYEMLTGDVLFKGQTPIQAMRAHDRGPQFPATWPEGVPANITAVLGKALARDPAARYSSAGAFWHALNDLETQAQAAREAAQRTALAAQWRAEAERALAAKEWDATRMAIGRWRAVAPDDVAIQDVQTRLERLTASPPVQVQPSSSPRAKPEAQERVLADLLERTTEPKLIEKNKSADAMSTSVAQKEMSPTVSRSGQIVGGAIGVSIVLFLVWVLITNNPFSGRTAAAPTAAPADTATAATATPAPAATAAPTAAPATAATAAPAANGASAGGTLKLLWWQAPTILNTHKAQGTKDQDASRLITEPLAALGPDGKLVARLAAEIPSYENGGIAKDNLSITWKLKKGVKWSDGTDFTAEDVVFTWQYCADPATACTTASNFDPISKVEAIDATTAKITWKEANTNPFISFVGFSGPIIQKKQFADCVGAKAETCPANNAPVGTGPYMVKDFKPGDVVVYEKSPTFRDADKVAFDGVEIKGGGDAVSAARAVLETGEVDYAWNLQVEPRMLDEILKGGKGTLVVAPGPNIERILINFANPDPALGDKRSEPDQPHPFLTDLKVRQALAMALDRQLISDQGYGKAGKPTCSEINAPPEYMSSITSCPQDIEGAKKLLADAGWTDTDGDGVVDKDGKPLAISYQTTINAVRQKTQAIVKSQWAAIGVNVQLRAIDAAVFFSSDVGNSDTAAKFYADVEMFTNGNSLPDPTNYLAGYTCAEIAQKSNNWNLNNYNRYCNKDYDAVIDELKKTTDEAKRKELIVKANDILVNDVVIIPLVARSTPSAMINGLKGPTGNQWDTELWNIAEWSR